MGRDSTKQFVISVSATVLVAVAGWYVVDYLNAKRDAKNKRFEQRMIYAADAYRDIAAAVCRKELSQEQKYLLENAYMNIQLFGTDEERDALFKVQPQGGGTDFGPVMEALRKSIRKELRLPPVEEGIKFWRFDPTSRC